MADKRKAAQASDADALAKRVRQDDAGGLVLGSRASAAQALVQKQQRTSALRSPVLSLSGAHGAEVLDVKFSPDGSTLAAASADRTISLWETYGENRNIGQLQGHKLAVTSIAWLPPRGDTPAMLVSGSADGTLALWDVSSGEKLRRLRGHRGIVNDVACSPTGRPLVASAADDGRVLLWDLDSRHPVEELDLGYPVTAVAFAEDATQLFVGGLDNAIRVRCPLAPGVHADVCRYLTSLACGRCTCSRVRMHFRQARLTAQATQIPLRPLRFRGPARTCSRRRSTTPPGFGTCARSHPSRSRAARVTRGSTARSPAPCLASRTSSSRAPGARTASALQVAARTAPAPSGSTFYSITPRRRLTEQR